MSSEPSGYDDGGPGIESEELVKELLQKSAWPVKELRKASDGGAPMLENKVDNSLRLVDFQTHNDTYGTHYVEVKSKGDPIEFGIENELRHGWEKNKHDDYIRFARKYTDDPVYVFVHERKSGVILRHRVRDLSIVQEITDKSKLAAFDADVPMYMFRRDDFEVVTDDVSQYSTGFGQSGLLQNDIDLSPFGHNIRDQFRLADFGGDFQ